MKPAASNLILFDDWILLNSKLKRLSPSLTSFNLRSDTNKYTDEGMTFPVISNSSLKSSFLNAVRLVFSRLN